MSTHPILWVTFFGVLIAIYAVAVYLEKKQAAEAKRRLELQMNLKMEEYQSPPDWHERRRYVLERDHHACVKCGSTESLHVHHVVPRKVRRDHGVGNLITLCHVCHGKEHHTTFLSNDERNLRMQLKHSMHRGKSVKARKAHTCTYCHRAIMQGEHYLKIASADISFDLRYQCEGDAKICGRCTQKW